MKRKLTGNLILKNGEKILNHFSTKKKFSLDDVINQEFKYDTEIFMF